MESYYWRNRKRAYSIPEGLAEKHDFFIGNPVSAWKASTDYQLAFAKIYGMDALNTALEFYTVPENRDETCVPEPRFKIPVKAAEPGPIPAPGTDPLLKQVAEDVKQILAIVRDLEGRA